MPIKRSSLEQRWYYRVVKVLFLLLPLLVFLIVFLKGNINICNISPDNILNLFQNNVLYFVIGLLAYYLILTMIWRILLYIFFGGLENDTSKKGGQAAQSVDPAPQSAAPAAQSVNPVAQPAPVKPKPKSTKKVVTCLIIIVLVGFVIFAVYLAGNFLLPKIDLSSLEHLNLLSTPQTGLPFGSGPVGYQYWKGDMPNSYYLLNIYGERARQVTGKPFMVLTYDKTTLEITDVEFGLSEVTQIALANPSDFPAPPEPTLDANNIDFYKVLDLKSPVDMLVGWSAQYPGGEGRSINNGVQQFSFLGPLFTFGPIRGTATESWTFTYTSSIMTGGVTNLDTTYYVGGTESETNAFNLRKIK